MANPRRESGTLRRVPRRTGGTLVGRLGAIGHAPGDDAEERVSKSTLTLVNAFIVGVASVWVVTYALLGRWVSAAIPFGFQVGAIAALVVFARTRRLATLRTGLLALMGTLPFLLQWSLGGFAKGSAVAVWAVVVPMLAPLFGARSWPWLTQFVALAAVSALVDSRVAALTPELPPGVVAGFFALNLTGAASAGLVAAGYAVQARDRARRRLADEHRLLGLERAKSERLLLNILPAAVAERLKEGAGVIADSHPHVTVLFADLVGFTPLSDRLGPEAVVGLLNDIFSAFDRLSEAAAVEKIKTVGDEYMVVAGLDGAADGDARIARVALGMREEIRRLAAARPIPVSLRVGVHCGPVVAGVIGRSKFSFDLWGDTVNLASRMESQGLADHIQISGRTALHLGDAFVVECRGEVDVKGKGTMTTWFLMRPRA